MKYDTGKVKPAHAEVRKRIYRKRLGEQFSAMGRKWHLNIWAKVDKRAIYPTEFCAKYIPVGARDKGESHCA